MNGAILKLPEESLPPISPFVSKQLKSSLKAHCVPGPKSPKRISAKVAAVPPPILKDAFEFYSLLKDDELASASVREHLGFLSQELAMNFSIERSVDKLLDCDLNSNAAT